MFKQHSIRPGGAMSMTPLDQSIDEAERLYYPFRKKLKSLISTLKNHHEAQLAFNRSQMQATTAICDFLINTPLSKCAIGKSSDKTVSVVLRYKHDSDIDEEWSQTIVNEDSSTSKDENEAKKDSPKESTENPPEEAKEDPPKETKRKEIKDESSTNEQPESKVDKPWSAGSIDSFDNLLNHNKNLDDVEKSFVGAFNASNDLNLAYAKNNMEWIIGYLVELEEIISTRIEGKLFQFGEMRKVYAHYTDKVQGLNEKVDKTKKQGAISSLQEKLDRNRLKLGGAEEAHNDLGKGLLSLMEEVTVHYFKDFIPLLHMIIQQSINHSSDVASVMKKLEHVDATLKDICEEHGLSISGRLKELRPASKKDEMEEEVISKEALTEKEEEKKDEDL